MGEQRPDWVQLDGHVQIDADVVLGCLPGRQLATRTLTIGTGAVLRSGTVIYAGSSIGRGLETGHHVVIREESRVGEDVRIWNSSTVDYGCVLGDRVKIHCNCYVAQFSVIEDDAFLAPGVTIANDKYPGWGSSPIGLVGPTIRRGAQVGVNVTILPGVTIGAGAIVGAGSVVTRDVADGWVVVGNPARRVISVQGLQAARARVG